ncbi:unnamed protein product [Paramecium octaurelia]|uniref:Protein kinase domain-containing protein n=1 Tax=Paramecium octaurelia TaxID=43137 RepID=A0A8S1UJ84_PAROT|nr:unnamed protein product [Paramecium octaurelia]
MFPSMVSFKILKSQIVGECLRTNHLQNTVPIQDNIRETILQRWTSLSINIIFQLFTLLGQVDSEESGRSVIKKQVFAMKEISKALVLFKQSVHCIMRELQFLTELRHNFIINVFAAFQDNQNLYLVLDYLGGGDLRFHLGRQRKFTEEQTKFFAACIIIGLEYLHENNIIHRDIKPENLILDDQGYVRITDLGVAVKKTGQNFETSGTPGYMAPEVIFRQDHRESVDFFALGVICYEFMTGRRPYYGNRREIREQILAKQVQIQRSNEGWSNKSIDFINMLLQRKPQNRLINPRLHRWFNNFSFELLIQKQIKAPFIPNNQDNFDKSQMIYEDEENNQIIKLHQHLIRENQEQFQGYQHQERTQQFLIKSKKSTTKNKNYFNIIDWLYLLLFFQILQLSLSSTFIVSQNQECKNLFIKEFWNWFSIF